jgi:PAS domain S-box-containing protein
MRGNRRILFLVLIMTGVAIGVGRIALYVLYQAAFDQQRGRLVEVAQSQARLLEAVARFNSQHYGAEHTPEEAFDVVLSQMRDAHERFRGFGETGEFTLAKLEGDQIIFLLRHRHYDLDNPEPVSFSSTDIAEPMRRALAGESGTVVGLDYRGEKVLAAYEYVAELNLGIVAKVDLAELRQPFINAALLAGGVGLGFVFLGSILFWRVSTPLLRHIEENEKRYRAVFEQAADAIVLIDVETGAIVEFNDRTCETLGYSREELQRLKLSDIEVIESTADEARPAQGVLENGRIPSKRNAGQRAVKCGKS